MTLAEIQSPPYSLTNSEYLLSISDIEKTTCFVGEIKKLQLIKVGVVGIFTNIKYDYLSNTTETVFLKAFYYDSPKYQFKLEDCPDATHFIISSEFEPNENAQKRFIQRLSHSEINKTMREPCKKLFSDNYLL